MTRGLKAWCCIAILAIASRRVSGQDTASGQSPPISQEPHTVQGTVVNSLTGEPVYRALVQIGGQFAALTDHEGHFEFEGVTGSEAPPWAMKPGYFDDPGSRRFLANTQSASQPVVVKLIPEAVISGTVTGQDGAPLEGIPIELKMLSISDGLPRWQVRQGTMTNSEGQYRFFELQAGKYAVATGFHVEGLADEKNSVAYIPVRYPAATGTDTQAQMELAAGDHREVTLSPEVERLYPVIGVVNGAGESRGVSFRVETAGGEEISAVSHFNARTGEFRLLLPGGTYTVTATAYLPRGPLESRLQLSVPQAPVSGVSFALAPGASIPVEVEAETADQTSSNNGKGADSGPSLVTGQAPTAYITLVTADPASAQSYPATPPDRHRGADTAASAAGPLLIDNVPPGRYLLQVQPSQSSWYVSSAHCGGVDLMHDELAIGDGIAGCSIRVVLRNDSGTVHVTARSGDDAAQLGGKLYVTLYPLDDFVRHPEQGGGTDFNFQGVAPGAYLVMTLDHQEELPYRDPEAMRRYAGLGQEITLSPNGTANIEVSLAHGGP